MEPTKFKFAPASKKPARASRVANVIQQALSTIFYKEHFYHPELGDFSVTVSEVNVSPDLRNATVYITPLKGVENKALFMEFIAELTPQLRHMVTNAIQLKYSPMLYFKLDNSFDHANKISKLLNDIKA